MQHQGFPLIWRPAARSSVHGIARRPDLRTATAEAVVVLLSVGLALAAGFAGWAVGHSGRSTSAAPAAAAAAAPRTFDPHVAAGAHEFVGFACAQCHGMNGRGGVSPDVPALKEIGKSMAPAQLRQIIDHGLGESANPTKPYMPVWGQVISATQVSDLIAYIKAGLPTVPDATPQPVPTGQGTVVAGQALYIRYGCIDCHGPNGLGGVPNPLSPDKTIPPLSGADFRQQFDTAAKIEAVIRSGSVIGRAPIVSMPHWGGILSNTQLQELADYIETLKSG